MRNYYYSIKIKKSENLQRPEKKKIKKNQMGKQRKSKQII